MPFIKLSCPASTGLQVTTNSSQIQNAVVNNTTENVKKKKKKKPNFHNFHCHISELYFLHQIHKNILYYI